MKKKLGMLVIAALMATTICGCSGGGQTESKPAETQATQKAETQAASGAESAESTEEEDSGEDGIDYSGTITMICSSDGTAAFDAVLAEYQKIHPDVTMEYIIWETVTDFETMMTNYIATNTLPDMYCSQVGVVEQQYAAEGYLLPLDDLNIEENLVNGDKSLIKYKDVLYAFPMTIGYSVTFCNNDKLKELMKIIQNVWMSLLTFCKNAGKRAVSILSA